MQPSPRQKLISSLSRSASLKSHSQSQPLNLVARQFFISTPQRSSDNKTLTTRIPPPPPARWITDLRSRVGKCIIFGCSNQQVSRAASVLRAIAVEWKELLAGSEGFLTGGRRGLDSQKIAWGEMDSFVGLSSFHTLPLPLSRLPVVYQETDMLGMDI